ncbi:Arc family DNA-binding protein [Aeromonas veronii]
MKVSNIAPFGVRMPPELKQQLEKSAKKNSRSLNAEVVYWLQKAMDEQSSVDMLGSARQMEFRVIDGLGGARKRQQSDTSSAQMVEQMKLILAELEQNIVNNQPDE